MDRPLAREYKPLLAVGDGAQLAVGSVERQHVTKRVLPTSHVRLQRALAAEAREYGEMVDELAPRGRETDPAVTDQD